MRRRIGDHEWNETEATMMLDRKGPGVATVAAGNSRGRGTGMGASVFQQSCKRLLDVGLSLALFVVLLPVFFVVTVLVKLTSRGPVLYKQQRRAAPAAVHDL